MARAEAALMFTALTRCRAQESGKGVSIIEIAERVQGAPALSRRSAASSPIRTSHHATPTDPTAAGPVIRPSSPRTVEAFLQSGIDPEDLVYKTIEYFNKRCNGNTELAQEAFTFFESQRHKRIEELKNRRQALIDEGWKPAVGVAAAASAEVGDTDDMVEKERKRLEVLRKR